MGQKRPRNVFCDTFVCPEKKEYNTRYDVDNLFSFLCYSYIEALIQRVICSHHNKSFLAIPDMLGFYWTKVVQIPATLKIALREFQYVYVLQLGGLSEYHHKIDMSIHGPHR